MSARTEDLFQSLQARILSGELSPGSRLPPERQLAESYGTNRNTLREAIRRLEQSKLVTVRQGQGVTVQDFRSVGTLDILGPYLKHCGDANERARTLLDALLPRTRMITFAVEAAAERAEPADLARLDDCMTRAKSAERARDSNMSLVAQQEWFEALMVASHNLPLRWASNPLLAASRAMMDQNAALMIFEPSFAEMAKTVNAAIGRRDSEEAVRVTTNFYAEIDAILSAFLRELLTDEEKTA